MGSIANGDLGRALGTIKAVVGDGGWVQDPDAHARYETEERGLFSGPALLVVRPSTTQQVSGVVAACATARIPVIPIGGRTGLVGGGVPTPGHPGVVVSLERMNRVRALDAVNHTLTAEAGCILATVQQAAADADRLFPLSLGAEGSCVIGGNISSNAGGIQVLRYGNMRELVLGLEVVLPDGCIWNGLRGLRKDNTGYDMKHLFIGAEGTLGIVTAAVLKLFPRPVQSQTALLAVPDVQSALRLFAWARAETADQLTAFELLPRFGMEISNKHAGSVDPLEHPYPWYVLMEIASSRTPGPGEPDLSQVLQSIMEGGFGQGLIIDGVVASSAAQRTALWRIREGMWQGQQREGASIKHDVSVPISAVAEFMQRGTAACHAVMPEARVLGFGHIGDGNIHFNLAQPPGAEPDAFMAQSEEVHEAVHRIVTELHGSISAEHGIGQLKRSQLALHKDPVEMAMMMAVKATFDPLGIMNPGKLLPG